MPVLYGKLSTFALSSTIREKTTIPTLDVAKCIQKFSRKKSQKKKYEFPISECCEIYFPSRIQINDGSDSKGKYYAFTACTTKFNLGPWIVSPISFCHFVYFLRWNLILIAPSEPVDFGFKFGIKFDKFLNDFIENSVSKTTEINWHHLALPLLPLNCIRFVIVNG